MLIATGITVLLVAAVLMPVPARADTSYIPAPATAPPTNSTIPSSDARLTVTTSIKYYPRGPDFDAYIPTAKSTPRPVLIMVHGGGWAGGDQSELAPWAKQAAVEQGWAVFTVDYRLDSTDPVAWADELHDVQAAIRYISIWAERWNVDPDRIMLLGDSAGANLVALISSVGTADPVKGSAVGGGRNLAVPIVAVAEWSPPTNLAELVPEGAASPTSCGSDPECDFAWNSSAVANYIGCEPSVCPLAYLQASPISWVRKRTAPSFVANGTQELIPLSQVQDYVNALNADQVTNHFVILDTALHAYQYGDTIWPTTVSFLSAQLTARAAGTSPASAHPHSAAGATASATVTTASMIGAGIIVALGMLAVVVVRRRRRSQKRRRSSQR